MLLSLPSLLLPSLPVVLAEHVADDGHELHHPLVQVQVLQTLEQVSVLTSVTADHGDLLGLGLGGQDQRLREGGAGER